MSEKWGFLALHFSLSSCHKLTALWYVRSTPLMCILCPIQFIFCIIHILISVQIKSFCPHTDFPLDLYNTMDKVHINVQIILHIMCRSYCMIHKVHINV